MDLFDDTSQKLAREILSVSELTRTIKILIETGLPVVWVAGEISNFKHHASGHMYFSIKDAQSQISCVMWSSRNMTLRFRPVDGMMVHVQGRVTVYERRGQYQLDVLQMLPAGVGELQLAFEQLKQRLEAEGLFDAKNKKPLPQFPRRIGIVTSPTGAAIRDMLSVIRRRWPCAEIILRPVLVQGPGAGEEIACAIEECNAFGELDVLIVGRGGGSMEDLWAFNEERVARAIFASRIPIVSAVGHEVDFTIADYVADMRAPTPSAAGELVVPDAQEVGHSLASVAGRAYRQVNRQLALARERLRRIEGSYALRRPLQLLKEHAQTLDELQRRLQGVVQQRLSQSRLRLQGLENHLRALSYHHTLQRGFTMTRDAATGKLLKRAAETTPGQQISIEYFDGTAGAEISRSHLRHLPATTNEGSR